MAFILQVIPFFLVLIVVPIILAKRFRGLNTWFPAQILALFGLVVGIVLNHNGIGTFMEGQPPLLIPTLTTAAAVALASFVLR